MLKLKTTEFLEMLNLGPKNVVLIKENIEIIWAQNSVLYVKKVEIM